MSVYPLVSAASGYEPGRYTADGAGDTPRRSTGFVAHAPEHALAVVAGESAAWYHGKRGFLPPVAIVPGRPVTSDERPAQVRLPSRSAEGAKAAPSA